jgi:hypothetical protein
MARVAEVLDDLLGLPVTPGAVDVLEGRPQLLESPAVVGGAIAVPGGDISLQDALTGASVEVYEGLRGQT